jgi:hypothetical protein
VARVAQFGEQFTASETRAVSLSFGLDETLPGNGADRQQLCGRAYTHPALAGVLTTPDFRLRAAAEAFREAAGGAGGAGGGKAGSAGGEEEDVATPADLLCRLGGVLGAEILDQAASVGDWSGGVCGGDGPGSRVQRSAAPCAPVASGEADGKVVGGIRRGGIRALPVIPHALNQGLARAKLCLSVCVALQLVAVFSLPPVLEQHPATEFESPQTAMTHKQWMWAHDSSNAELQAHARRTGVVMQRAVCLLAVVTVSGMAYTRQGVWPNWFKEFSSEFTNMVLVPALLLLVSIGLEHLFARVLDPAAAQQYPVILAMILAITTAENITSIPVGVAALVSGLLAFVAWNKLMSPSRPVSEVLALSLNFTCCFQRFRPTSLDTTDSIDAALASLKQESLRQARDCRASINAGLSALDAIAAAVDRERYKSLRGARLRQKLSSRVEEVAEEVTRLVTVYTRFSPTLKAVQARLAAMHPRAARAMAQALLKLMPVASETTRVRGVICSVLLALVASVAVGSLVVLARIALARIHFAPTGMPEMEAWRSELSLTCTAPLCTVKLMNAWMMACVCAAALLPVLFSVIVALWVWCSPGGIGFEPTPRHQKILFFAIMLLQYGLVIAACVVLDPSFFFKRSSRAMVQHATDRVFSSVPVFNSSVWEAPAVSPVVGGSLLGMVRLWAARRWLSSVAAATSRFTMPLGMMTVTLQTMTCNMNIFSHLNFSASSLVRLRILSSFGARSPRIVVEALVRARSLLDGMRCGEDGRGDRGIARATENTRNSIDAWMEAHQHTRQHVQAGARGAVGLNAGGMGAGSMQEAASSATTTRVVMRHSEGLAEADGRGNSTLVGRLARFAAAAKESACHG